MLLGIKSSIESSAPHTQRFVRVETSPKSKGNRVEGIVASRGEHTRREHRVEGRVELKGAWSKGKTCPSLFLISLLQVGQQFMHEVRVETSN